MTRIVGGIAKGRRLAVPPKGTRPTSDRAREALFNTLAAYLDIEGAHVLDLFAGTGAVGLEALSRGAASATFVESDQRVAAVLKQNIAAVALPGATLQRAPVATYLTVSSSDRPFDFAFADPPYALPEEHLATMLQILADERWLTPQAIVVVERSARGAPPEWPDMLEPLKNRRYGEGLLWYGRRR